jgi:acetyl-CoA carboxylase carboxyl transferase subunit alpha
MILGHQKGRDTKENLARNFGMSRPEGYRKAVRLMRQAEKFGMPVVTLIDTPGAEPNIGSEERGQATAIAESILTMSDLRVPIVAVVISEGGSGGALAIGVADRVLMLEHAIYSVISPEGAAAILWKDAAKAPDAAATMRITAQDLLGFAIIDDIVAEPVPAHEAPKAAIRATGDAIVHALDELDGLLGEPNGIDELLQARHDKFRRIGAWRDAGQPAG